MRLACDGGDCMTAFLITLNQLAILALLTLIGFYIKRKNFINDDAVSGLSFILINLCLPAIVFTSLQIEYSKQRLMIGMAMIFLYMASMLIGYFLAAVMARIMDVTGDERRIWLAGGLLFNGIFIGVPITGALFGESALFCLCFGIVGWNILAYSLGISIFRKDAGRAERFRFILKNPVIISCVIGLAVFAFQISIPSYIGRTVEYLAQSTTPVSMIILGSLVSGSRASEIFTGKNVYVFSALRLFVIPVVTMLFTALLMGDVTARNTVALGAAMPAAVIVPVFAERYANCGKLGAKYCVVSTILSLIGLPVMSLIITNF